VEELPAKSENFDTSGDGPEPEPELEAPREGTLAWLELQEHVLVEGLELPVVHKLKPGDTLIEPDGKHCAVVRAEGGRCMARPTRRYGVCLAHAGGGGWREGEDARRHSARGHARKAVLRQRRAVLGIGPHRSADPRQIARVHALDRAEQMAAALVDEPLDDPDLSSLARQRAVIAALDATFPLATATLELELPADAAQLGALSWQDMQALAARVLGYQQVPELEQSQ